LQAAPGRGRPIKINQSLREGLPGYFLYQPWVEEARNAAKAARLTIEEYLFVIAQVSRR
jgi:hypothetical protein